MLKRTTDYTDLRMGKTIGGFKLSDCIGKVIVTKKCSNETMHNLLKTNPHTFITK